MRTSINGSNSNDSLIGDNQDNDIQGLAGNDYLAGSGGNDSLNGGVDNDYLNAGDGDDTLSGGIGDDSLSGEDGNDTYLFAQGDGHDTISEFAPFGNSSDHLILSGDALTSANVRITRGAFGDDAILTFAGVSDSIQISSQFLFGSPETHIESITFSDGVTWDYNTFRHEYLARAGTAGDDSITGYYGSADTLRGGAGNDALNGLSGDDTYLFAQGDGQDMISDSTGFDQLKFSGAGLTSGNVQVVRRTEFMGTNRDFISIGFKGLSDSVTLSVVEPSIVDGSIGPYGVGSVTFADNVTWNIRDLAKAYLASASTSGNDTITGFATDDVITGGLGNDLINGGEGKNTYIHATGDGQDSLRASEARDTLVLVGTELGSTHVQLDRTNGGNDFVLRFDGVKDSIALLGYDENPGVTQSIRFGDNVSWTAADLRAFYLNNAITGGNDTINGFGGDDTIGGGLGDDVLNGKGGNDLYRHAQGDGRDTLVGSNGNDTLELSGAALNSNNVTLTRTVTGSIDELTLHFGGVSDTVVLQSDSSKSYFNDSDLITFSDGVIWDQAAVRRNYLAQSSTNGNDSIYGFETDDVLSGGLGDDFLNGLEGTDTYLFAQGGGHDTVSDPRFEYGTESLILSGAALTSTNVRLIRTLVYEEGKPLPASVNDLTLTFGGISDSVTLQGQFAYNSAGVDSVTFSDAVVWDDALLRAKYIASVNTGGNDTIAGFDNSDDVISGGLGNDLLAGLGGFDTYLHTQGDGQDTVIDDGFGRLTFSGKDLTLANLTLTRIGDSNDVTLGFVGSSDSVLLKNQFDSLNSGIALINFADGGSLQRETLAAKYVAGLGTSGNDLIYGTNLADSISGGLGNDKLNGQRGGDTYLFNKGDGQDTIIELAGGSYDDRLRIGSDLNFADVKINLLQDGTSVELSFAGNNDKITLLNEFGKSDAGVESVIAYNNGFESSYSSVDLARRYLNDLNTSGDDVITGFDFLSDSIGLRFGDPGAGNDRFDGKGGDDALSGGEGNDTLIGGAGNDRLEGGAGSDSADYSAATAAVTAELWRGTAANDGLGGNDVLVSIENLTGGNFNDLLAGDEAANLLDGAAGNDNLFAGGGNDTLQGGTGNDLLAGGAGNDSLNGGSGSDTADYASATAAVTAELWRGTASNDGQGGNDVLAGIENLNGGNFNDLLAGSEAANNLNGQGGNDSLFAGGGNDSLIGGNGNDWLAGGAGIDNLNGGAGIDTADYASATSAVTAELWRGTAANDGQGGNDVLVGIENLNGGGFNDLLVGDEAANSLNGAAGNDVLYGGGGADTLQGGNGNDFAAAGAGNDSIDGGSGIDTVDYASSTTGVIVELWKNSASNDGQGGTDVVLNFENLNGGNFNDFLVGNEGANVIVAGNGIDTVYGGGGDDFINGGNGNDLLVGGAGRDIYRFDSALNAASNLDTVNGFVVADDTISLARTIFGSVAAGTLGAGSLRAGAGVTTALDADDFILYNSSTGALYYDADGSGAGLAVQFAVLPVGLALTNNNFVAG